MLGPAPSPLDKIKDNYRWQVLLKGVDTDELHVDLHMKFIRHDTSINPGHLSSELPPQINIKGLKWYNTGFQNNFEHIGSYEAGCEG